MPERAHILSSIPGLQTLCAADARLRRAVALGDPHRAYAALAWARRTGRLRAHRDLVDRLLADRRAFAVPDAKELLPSVARGLGDWIEPSEDPRADDGTSIVTHWLVVLVPIHALAAYVVEPPSRDVHVAVWRTRARVPLRLRERARGWRRLVALAGSAALLLGLLWAISARRSLHVVNGFDAPVSVSVDGGEPTEIPANGHRELTVWAGARAVAAESLRGEPLDQQTVRVPRGGGVSVFWNVAGAAPVEERDVLYGDPGSSGRNPEDRAEAPPVLHCADPVFAVDRPSFAFEEPPESLPVMRHGSPLLVHVRRWVHLRFEDERSGAASCAKALLDGRRGADALAILESRAMLAGWDAETTADLRAAAAQVGGAEAERIAERLRRAVPAVHPGTETRSR